MRILHIPHSYAPNPGGLEYICQRLSEALAQQGHTVDVLVPDASYYRAMFEFGYHAIRPTRETLNGVNITRIPFCATPIYRLGNRLIPLVRKTGWQRLYWYLNYTIVRKLGEIHATRFIKEEIAHLQPDVVVTMAHMLPNMKWVLALHKEQPLPLVQMPLVHYEIQPEADDDFAQGLRHGISTVTLTRREATFITEHYGVNPASIFVGSTGTDIPETLPPPTDDDYVLFLSRKEHYKGLDAAIHAMRLVWQKQPHLKLILAGPRTVHSGFLDPLLASLSPQERANITEIGLVVGEEKSRLLRNARCLLFPSQSESFGVVLIEAMAHGTPPITWDIPLFREIIEHGQTGFLCEFGNVQSLADAVLHVAQNPARARTVGDNGRAYVKAHFRWDSVAANYLKAYDYTVRVMQNATPTPPL